MFKLKREWSSGAKVLGKLPVPGRPTHLDCSRARAYCACSRCGWGLFGHFFGKYSRKFHFVTPCICKVLTKMKLSRTVFIIYGSSKAKKVIK